MFDVTVQLVIVLTTNSRREHRFLKAVNSERLTHGYRTLSKLSSSWTRSGATEGTLRIRNGKMRILVRGSTSRLNFCVEMAINISNLIYPENYSKVCYIEVDLSHVKLDKQRNVQTKKKFYTVQYSIVLLFGMMELKAQIAWTENVSF